MKKEVILVPQDKCPLDVLAEMGERTKNAWIYLHENVYDKLRDSDDVCVEDKMLFTEFTWKETEDYPETKMVVNFGETWNTVCSISASDIAFKEKAKDPEEIFFLKMED